MGWASYAADLLDPPARQARARWLETARENQITPPGEWLVWFLLGGRGSGKTRPAAEDHLDFALRNPGVRQAIVAPTFGDGRDVCVEGESGLLAIMDDDLRSAVRWNRSIGELFFPNGSKSKLFSSDEPERLRGPQHHRIWFDELAAFKNLQATWDMAMFGLRLGVHPQVVVASTPKPLPLVKQLVKSPNTVVSRLTTYENLDNLAPTFREQILAQYEGTRLGRQELLGEILEDVEGALWSLDLIEQHRVTPVEVPEDLIRVALGVDPPGGRTECGIVAAGLAKDGRVFVQADLTAEGPNERTGPSPATWSRKVVHGYTDLRGDAVVVERNYGGEMVAHTVRTVPEERGYPSGRDVRIKEVNATRGKQVRAEPVVGLYEQNRVFHVGGFGKLESEMTSWVPGESPESPNRLDALVWCLYDLVISARKASSTGKMVDARSRGR